jgi:hypothetical protein
MNERRTLSWLGWIVGSLLSAMLVLNAIALSDIATTDASPSYTD